MILEWIEIDGSTSKVAFSLLIWRFSLGLSIQGDAEFLINIYHFKFAGGEGNTQFGGDITDASTYPPLQQRLRELWWIAQLRSLLGNAQSFQESHEDGSNLNFNEINKTLLRSHEKVFVPDEMEKKLAEIPGKWLDALLLLMDYCTM